MNHNNQDRQNNNSSNSNQQNNGGGSGHNQSSNNMMFSNSNFNEQNEQYFLERLGHQVCVVVQNLACIGDAIESAAAHQNQDDMYAVGSNGELILGANDDNDPVNNTRHEPVANQVEPESPLQSIFESNEIPPVSPGLYLFVLTQQLKMCDEHSIAVLILLEKVCQGSAQRRQRLQSQPAAMNNNNGEDEQLHGQVTINSKSIHRLILTGLLITQKYYNDFFYSNKFIAQIGGLQELSELNEMEAVFLELIEWRVSITTEEYNMYRNGIDQFFNRPLEESTKAIIGQIQAQIREFQFVQANNQLQAQGQPPVQESSQDTGNTNNVNRQNNIYRQDNNQPQVPQQIINSGSQPLQSPLNLPGMQQNLASSLLSPASANQGDNIRNIQLRMIQQQKMQTMHEILLIEEMIRQSQQMNQQPNQINAQQQVLQQLLQQQQQLQQNNLFPAQQINVLQPQQQHSQNLLPQNLNLMNQQVIQQQDMGNISQNNINQPMNNNDQMQNAFLLQQIQRQLQVEQLLPFHNQQQIIQPNAQLGPSNQEQQSLLIQQNQQLQYLLLKQQSPQLQQQMQIIQMQNQILQQQQQQQQAYINNNQILQIASRQGSQMSMQNSQNSLITPQNQYFDQNHQQLNQNIPQQQMQIIEQNMNELEVDDEEPEMLEDLDENIAADEFENNVCGRNVGLERQCNFQYNRSYMQNSNQHMVEEELKYNNYKNYQQQNLVYQSQQNNATGKKSQEEQDKNNINMDQLQNNQQMQINNQQNDQELLEQIKPRPNTQSSSYEQQ